MGFLDKLCRFCAKRLDRTPRRNITHRQNRYLLTAALGCIPASMSSDDGFPKFACCACANMLNNFVEFKSKALGAINVFNVANQFKAGLLDSRCRFCACELDTTRRKSIFRAENCQLLVAALQCIHVPISANDCYPEFSCNSCASMLQNFVEFQNKGLSSVKLFHDLESIEKRNSSGSEVVNVLEMYENASSDVHNSEEMHSQPERDDQPEINEGGYNDVRTTEETNDLQGPEYLPTIGVSSSTLNQSGSAVVHTNEILNEPQYAISLNSAIEETFSSESDDIKVMGTDEEASSGVHNSEEIQCQHEGYDQPEIDEGVYYYVCNTEETNDLQVPEYLLTTGVNRLTLNPSVSAAEHTNQMLNEPQDVTFLNSAVEETISAESEDTDVLEIDGKASSDVHNSEEMHFQPESDDQPEINEGGCYDVCNTEETNDLPEYLPTTGVNRLKMNQSLSAVVHTNEILNEPQYAISDNSAVEETISSESEDIDGLKMDQKASSDVHNFVEMQCQPEGYDQQEIDERVYYYVCNTEETNGFQGLEYLPTPGVNRLIMNQFVSAAEHTNQMLNAPQYVTFLNSAIEETISPESEGINVLEIDEKASSDVHSSGEMQCQPEGFDQQEIDERVNYYVCNTEETNGFQGSEYLSTPSVNRLIMNQSVSAAEHKNQMLNEPQDVTFLNSAVEETISPESEEIDEKASSDVHNSEEMPCQPEGYDQPEIDEGVYYYVCNTEKTNNLQVPEYLPTTDVNRLTLNQSVSPVVPTNLKLNELQHVTFLNSAIEETISPESVDIDVLEIVEKASSDVHNSEEMNSQPEGDDQLETDEGGYCDVRNTKDTNDYQAPEDLSTTDVNRLKLNQSVSPVVQTNEVLNEPQYAISLNSAVEETISSESEDIDVLEIGEKASSDVHNSEEMHSQPEGGDQPEIDEGGDHDVRNTDETNDFQVPEYLPTNKIIYDARLEPGQSASTDVQTNQTLNESHNFPPLDHEKGILNREQQVECFYCKESCTSTGESPQKCQDCVEMFLPKSRRSKREGILKNCYECRVCKKSCSSKSALITHIRVHSSKKIQKIHQCQVCKKCFSHRSGLCVHKKIHTREKPHQCNECKKGFYRKYDLALHLRNHSGEKPYQCQVCKNRFSDESSLSQHLRVHTGVKPFRCNECNKNFTHKSSLISHYRTHCERNFRGKSDLVNHSRMQTAVKSFQCNKCKKSFFQKHSLVMHLRRRHTAVKSFQCNECQKSFYQKRGLVNHLQIHFGVKSFKCNECQQSFFQKNSLDIHLRIHSSNEPFQCNDCEKSFSRKWDLVNHSRTHTDDKPFQCNECKKHFFHKLALLNHLRTHSSDESFQCNDCEKSFSRKGDLVNHSRTHTGEKPFHCNECEKSFFQKNALLNHIRIHSGVKSFQCNKCKKSYFQKNSLNIHLRVHSGKGPFQCNECKKKFSRKGDLVNHFRTHTGEKPFQCNECKKKFSHKIALLHHLRAHSYDESFQCNECKKNFSRKGDLVNHSRTHTGEKPFQCNECKKKFSLKIALRIHLKSHSPDESFRCNECKKSYSRKSDLSNHLRIHTTVKPFHCNECEKSFFQKNALVRHWQCHRPDKPLQCNKCKMRFTYKVWLTKHLLSHTG